NFDAAARRLASRRPRRGARLFLAPGVARPPPRDRRVVARDHARAGGLPSPARQPAYRVLAGRISGRERYRPGRCRFRARRRARRRRPERSNRQKKKGGAPGPAPAAFGDGPPLALEPLVRRALLPIGVLVLLEDRAARDDRGFAVGALHDLAQIEVLNRDAV